MNKGKDIKMLEMPEVIKKLVKTVKNRYKAVSTETIINMAIAKIAHILSSKRIKYQETEDVGMLNFYSIVFLPSGYGKDRIVSNLDKYVFPFYKNWVENTNVEYKKIMKDKIREYAIKKIKKDKEREKFLKEKSRMIRRIVTEISNGTSEGFFADAKTLSRAKIGSLLMTIGELGLFLKNMSSDQKRFITMIYDAYTGKIVSKSIKGEDREKNITDLPVNILFYSDPTLFERELKELFNSLMESGLGRRAVITFSDKEEHYEYEQDPKKARDEEIDYYDSLKEISQSFRSVFFLMPDNLTFKFTENAYAELYKYKLDNIKKAENIKKTLLKKEILSRELKVVKLSCLFACLNHMNIAEISEIDVRQAISSIEFLSKDFERFVNFKPKYHDCYDRIFEFFVENAGIAFSKTELINDYRNVFGISRDKLRSEFDKYMDTVQEIAGEKGYIIDKKSINRCSGCTYKLIKLQNCELSEKVIPLEKLLEIE